jgi:hypothetical protein
MGFGLGCFPDFGYGAMAVCPDFKTLSRETHR